MLTRATTLVPLLLALASPGCNSDDHQGDPDASGNGSGSGSGSGSGTNGLVTVPLQSLNSAAYTGPITIGSQTFNAIYDTGSSTIGVADSTCTTCNATPKYMPEATAVDQHKTGRSQYGDGSGWNGEIFLESSKLGTGPSVPIKFVDITTQTKGSSGQYFFQGGYAGIVGLGPDGALLAGTSSYITGAIAGGLPGVMSFHLCPDKGTMWLGGFDPSAVDGTVEYSSIVPIANMSGLYYAVNVGSAAVNGTDLGVGAADFGPTIIDTGTTISYVPSAVITKITTAINASPNYASVFGSTPMAAGACAHTTMTSSQIDAALPKLGVIFAGGASPIDMPATKSYLFFEGNGMYCLAFGDSGQLFGGIKASLFGASMLNGMIAVFDLASQRIGFAGQKGCANAQRTLEPSVAPAFTPDPSRPWYESDPQIRRPSFAR